MTEDSGPPAEDFNCIRSTVRDDGSVVILQIWLMGEPTSWLEYNAEQLDRLIAMLTEERAKLTSG